MSCNNNNKQHNLERFQSLPPVIYLIIQSYIPKDYKHFINSCKTILREIKYETIYYNLNQPFSFKFCQDFTFRDLILSKVKHKRYQISVNLRQFTSFCEYRVNPHQQAQQSHQSQAIYVHAGGIHRLKLQGLQTIRTLEPFNNIPELIFYSFPFVQDTNALTIVEKLTLNNFPALNAITSLAYLQECVLIDCPQVSDVSSLANVKTVYLENCLQIVNVSPLGNHARLTIINCGNGLIESIATLGTVRKSIELSGFSLIQDISMLHDIPEIKIKQFTSELFAAGLEASGNYHNGLSSSKIMSIQLENCHLRSYSPLGFIPIVKLSYLRNLTDLSGFRYVQSLEISDNRTISVIPYFPCLKKFRAARCYALGDITRLSHLSSVTLETCSGVMNLEPLSEVRHVQIISCSGVRSVDGLGKNHSVTLVTLDQIYSPLTSLQTVPEVKLINLNWLGMDQLGPFQYIQSLTIERNKNFLDTSLFKNLRYLHLSYCPALKSINGIADVHTVILEYLDGLVDISGLGRNYSVRLYKCDKIENVQPLISVQEVRISHCRRITNIDCLKNLIKFIQ